MSQLSLLGNIHSEVSLEGTLSDLDLNLSLKSDKGSLDSDIYINIERLDDLIYKGRLNLNHFNVDLF